MHWEVLDRPQEYTERYHVVSLLLDLSELVFNKETSDILLDFLRNWYFAPPLAAACCRGIPTIVEVCGADWTEPRNRSTLKGRSTVSPHGSSKNKMLRRAPRSRRQRTRTIC